ncbi:MAG: efflux transporter outer membrane subunit [Planctomycetota bacterium]
MTPLLAALSACVLHGCKAGPDMTSPDLAAQTPATWLSDMTPTDGVDDITRWWSHLEDPELSGLIERALLGSLSLAEARERIVGARARRGITNADRLPSLDLSASYERAQTGDEGFVLGGAPAGSDVDIYSLGVVAGWEIDLWGRVSRLVEAADADIAFAIEDFRAARVALAAEVAREVVAIRALDQDIELVTASIEADRDALAIARARADAGFGDELDAARAARVLDANRAAIPALRADRRDAELRLAVLIGARPGEADVASRSLPRRDILPGLGVPADLLMRRPDLRRAEREFAAATARIGAEQAAALPRFSLSGAVALQGPDAGDMINPDAYILSAGPSISLPIFDGARIASRVDQAESDQRRALLRLRAATLAAFAEVETASMRRARAEERAALLVDAERSADDAEALALDRYTSGTVDFLDVTEARSRRLVIERDRTRAERDAILRLIDLYTALGGGWDDGSQALVPESPEPSASAPSSTAS